MINLTELKKLCDEYDKENVRTNEYEGEAVYHYIEKKLNKSDAYTDKKDFTMKEIRKENICLCLTCGKTKDCRYFQNGNTRTSNTTEVSRCLK